jgi:sialidase-1
MKKIILMVLISSFIGNAGSAQSGYLKKQVIYEANTDGYYIYRIPALVASPGGTLLAFCSARKGKGGDWDPIDIVLRRSMDGGKTWTPAKAIVHKNSLPCDNPMPIVDFQTGEIHMLYQINYAQCYYIKSTDDGLTWSEPVDITNVIETFKSIYEWNVFKAIIPEFFIN